MLEARLDKEHQYVICGRTECGARMAYAAPRFGDDGPQSSGVIQFLPGWAPTDKGIWKLSRYASLRLRRGQTSKLRKYPEGDGISHNDVMDNPYEVLPVRAKCPTCGFMNLVLAEKVLAKLVGLIPAPPVKSSVPG